jgi:hypothetical protein
MVSMDEDVDGPASKKWGRWWGVANDERSKPEIELCHYWLLRHRHCTAERFFASSPPYHVCKGTRRSNGHGGVCFFIAVMQRRSQFGFAARFYTLIYFSIMCTNNNSVKASSAQKPAAPYLAPASLDWRAGACLAAWKAAVAPLLSFSHVALVSWLLLLSTSQSTRIMILMVHLPLRA